MRIFLSLDIRSSISKNKNITMKYFFPMVFSRRVNSIGFLQQNNIKTKGFNSKF